VSDEKRLASTAATALLLAALALIALSFSVGMQCGRDLGFRDGQKSMSREGTP
jgi:hypothetical protein